MLETDTAKSDLTLLVLGCLAAAFFYWIYPSVHPLSTADSSLSRDGASQASSDILVDLGYFPSDDNYSSFRVQTDILTYKQRLKSSRSGVDSAITIAGPEFYWRTRHKISLYEGSPRQPEQDNTPGIVELEISESGEFLSLINRSGIFPTRSVEQGFFEEYLPRVASSLQAGLRDPGALERFQFSLNGQSDSGVSEQSQSDRVMYQLTRQDIRNMARYHLNRTGWLADDFSVQDIDLAVQRGSEIAQVLLESSRYEQETIRLEILPTGGLISLSHNFSGQVDDNEVGSDIRFGIIVISLLLFAVWLFILLFIRIRLRLIDIKLSVLVAVLVGFLLPMQFLFEWIFEYIYLFEEFGLREIFARLFALGFTGAAGSICFFATTAVGDSITRDNWSEKLRTFDLLRIGSIYNRPIGLVLLRSVIYSYLLAGVFVFLFSLFPERYVQIQESFRSDRFLLPAITVLVTNGLLFLIATQAVLLIMVGKLRAYTKKGIWVLLLTAVTAAIIGVVPQQIGPWTTSAIISGIIGLGIGWIYLKEDYLTIFFALTIFGIHMMSVPGWVMENSPDSYVFYISVFFVIVVFIFGVFGFFKGKPIDQLPEYVPDYINELKKEERIKQELQIARKVQTSFLPEQMPHTQGMEFAAMCTPALETGGDYYDFININENSLAVAIGDVSGKGIEAAFYMTFTKGVLHALCGDSGSTVDVLSKINSLFLTNARKGTFISMIFGIIDRKEGTFRFARGGHNPLLHFSAKKGTITEYRPSGLGLGMADSTLFHKNTIESVIKLEPGDLIILFTDGIVEATNARGDFYGDDRLQSVIKRYSKRSASKIISAISKDLYEFGGGADLHDDMTAIVIKKQ